MEQYKEKLKHQNMLLSVGIVIMAGFSLLFIGNELGWFSFVRPITGDSHWHSAWNGFVSGASFGLMAMMAAFLIRNCLAMKSEAALKKLYVKSHDERSSQIVILARNTAMQIQLWAGCIACVIAGYFSITVSITILACLLFSSCLSLILVGYYNKKM